MGSQGRIPHSQPGTDAGCVCQRALHDAKLTKHTQSFAEGKGYGVRDIPMKLHLKS